MDPGIIGPLLFLMYINDLPKVCPNSRILLFADDAKLFKRISSIVDCLALQSDINNILQWCSKWKLSLNVSKCYFIRFTNKRNVLNFSYCLGESVLEEVKNIRDLGIFFSSNLSFKYHIEYI